MAYRDNDVDPAAPPALSFHRFGPVKRWLLTALVVGCAAFFSVMTGLTSVDSWLRCERAGPAARCALHEDYPGGVARTTPLPPLRDARAEVRHTRGRGGVRRHLVLVLDAADGTTTEYPGVGKSGARAEGVAAGVSAFLQGEEAGPRRWRLRESSYAATLLMAACALGALFTVPIWFRRVRVAFDPRERAVRVRIGRWPARAREWSLPLADIARAERATAQDSNGELYSARLVLRDGACPGDGDVGLMHRRAAGADAVVRALDGALGAWRDASATRA